MSLHIEHLLVDLCMCVGWSLRGNILFNAPKCPFSNDALVVAHLLIV